MSSCCDGEITVDAWGIMSGKEWSYKAKRGINQIIIRYGSIVDSIMFKDVHTDNSSPKFGGPGGNRTDKVDIDFPSEFLTGISGTYGLNIWPLSHHLCSIKFQTNVTEYGPFGSHLGQPFCFHAKDGMISGFHCRAGQYLDAIGVYLKPAFSLHREPNTTWGSSNCGREFDDGVFCTVKEVHVHFATSDVDVVSAVQFQYEDEDGTAFWSSRHGGHGGDHIVKKIGIDGKDEYLIGIEGFHGPIEGYAGLNVITSLTFHTNKSKYGPFGVEIGNHFTWMNARLMGRNVKVVGFHGRCGAYLDSIGIHTKHF